MKNWKRKLLGHFHLTHSHHLIMRQVINH